jgi:hypothetical protein
MNTWMDITILGKAMIAPCVILNFIRKENEMTKTEYRVYAIVDKVLVDEAGDEITRDSEVLSETLAIFDTENAAWEYIKSIPDPTL